MTNTVNDMKRTQSELGTSKAELRKTKLKLEEVTSELELLQRKSAAIMDAKNRAQKEARDLKSQLGGETTKQDALDRKVNKAMATAEKVGDAPEGSARSVMQLRNLEATFSSALAEIREALNRSSGAADLADAPRARSPQGARVVGKVAVNSQAKSVPQRTAASPTRKAVSPTPASKQGRASSASAPKRAGRPPPSSQGQSLHVSASVDSFGEGSTTASSTGGLEAAQVAAARQMRMQLAQGAAMLQAGAAQQGFVAEQQATQMASWAWPEEVPADIMELPDTARGDENG